MKLLLIFMLLIATPSQSSWWFRTALDPMTDRVKQFVAVGSDNGVVLRIYCSKKESFMIIFHGKWLMGERSRRGNRLGDRRAKVYFRFGEDKRLRAVYGVVRSGLDLRRQGGIQPDGRDTGRFLKRVAESTATRLLIQTVDLGTNGSITHEVSLDGAAEALAQMTLCNW
jgi:hypothetical protein